MGRPDAKHQCRAVLEWSKATPEEMAQAAPSGRQHCLLDGSKETSPWCLRVYYTLHTRAFRAYF